jgi:hypothetical protein
MNYKKQTRQKIHSDKGKAMRSIRHWTPRYIYNRVALSLYEKQHPDHPWLTHQAINILTTLLKKSDVGLEWGSGRSTIWFASRIQHLVSVEDNLQWYQKVKELLAAQGLSNVDYQLAQDRATYVGIVDRFADESLDFVLVDGQSHRSSCAVAIIKKIRVGGVLVLDNANWFLPCNSYAPNSRTVEMGPISTEWQHFLELVQNWRMIWTSNGVTDTAFFIKAA